MTDRSAEITVQDLQKIQQAMAQVNDEARASLSLLRRHHLDEMAGLPLRLSREAYLPVVDSPSARIAGLRLIADSEDGDTRQELAEAMRTWVLSLSRGDQAAAFVVCSSGQELQVYLASHGELEDQVSRVQASFPGVRLEPPRLDASPRALVDRLDQVYVITGIPRMEQEQRRHDLAIDRVIRGMRGRPFALVVVARPVPAQRLLSNLQQLRDERGRNYERIRATITREVGDSVTRTLALSAGGSMGGSFSMGRWFPVFRGWLLSGLSPGAVGNISYSEGRTLSRGLSTGLEKLNAFAEAYEAALQEQEERLERSLAEGGWEAACYVLAGRKGDAALAGALWARELTGQMDPLEPFRVLPVGASGEDPRQLLLASADLAGKGVPLYTALTSSELAGFMSLPQEDHPGFEIRRSPRFSVNVPRRPPPDPAGGIALGQILDRDVALPGEDLRVAPETLASHLLVTGITGSGKSTTMRTMLAQLEVPFLIIEPAKAEYRSLVVDGEPIRVITAGNELVAPLRFNPFEVPEGVGIVTHMDALAAVINAAFPMEGPMASIVEQAIFRAYSDLGWDLDAALHPRLREQSGPAASETYPTMEDFYHAVRRLVDEQGYAGEYGANVRAALLTRIRSLCIGARGKLFNTREPLRVAELVSTPTVMELKDLGSDETKTFLMGMLLLRLYYHFEHQTMSEGSGGLRALLVVEEAHRLFQRPPARGHGLVGTDTRHQSVQVFERIMAEARAYGLGLAVVDQLPLRLSDGALKNTSTKIVHRLSAREDAEEVGGAMGLSARDASFICQLRVGEVLLHQADMDLPVHLRVRADVALTEQTCETCTTGIRSNADVRRHSESRGYQARDIRPPGMEGLRVSIEQQQPGALLEIGDKLLFSLFVGDIEAPESIVGQALDALYSLARGSADPDRLEVLHPLLVDITEAALRRRWYLEEQPEDMYRAAKALQGALTWTEDGGVQSDPQGMIQLRRALEGARRVGEAELPALSQVEPEVCRRFCIEAQNDADAVIAELQFTSEEGVDPAVDEDLVVLVDRHLLWRLYGPARGERLAGYATCLFLGLAGQLRVGLAEEEAISAAARFHLKYAANGGE